MSRKLEGFIIHIQPEDVLTEKEYQLLQRARAGEIPCPWCERPLEGSFYFFLDDGDEDKGVRLRCSNCGFDERWGFPPEPVVRRSFGLHASIARRRAVQVAAGVAQ